MFFHFLAGVEGSWCDLVEECFCEMFSVGVDHNASDDSFGGGVRSGGEFVHSFFRGHSLCCPLLLGRIEDVCAVSECLGGLFYLQCDREGEWAVPYVDYR